MLFMLPWQVSSDSFGGFMHSTRIFRALLSTAALVVLFAIGSAGAQILAGPKPAKATKMAAAPTVTEAEAFMKKVEDELEDITVRASRAAWVQENFITDDTEVLSAQAQEKVTAVVTQYALEARRFDNLKMPAELARKFLLLKLSLTAPAPNNDKERAELTRIATSLDSDYGKGKYCKPQADGKQNCLSLNDLSRTMANSTNPDELLDAWVGWHKISPPMRQRYTRFVELSNKGARELGFKDTGAMWRSNY